MIIEDNYLLLSNSREFNSRLSKYFYERLQLFLSITDKNIPQIVFSSSKKTLEKHYGSFKIEGIPGYAFYDEDTSTIVFNAEHYNLKSNKKYLKKEDFTKYRTAHYVPKATVVVISGSFDEKSVHSFGRLGVR